MDRQVSEESLALLQEIEDENLSGPEGGGKDADAEWPLGTFKKPDNHLLDFFYCTLTKINSFIVLAYVHIPPS